MARVPKTVVVPPAVLAAKRERAEMRFRDWQCLVEVSFAEAVELEVPEIMLRAA